MLDKAEISESSEGESNIWAVTAMYQNGAAAGYRTTQVEAANQYEAIGRGLLKIEELNPGMRFMAPAALQIVLPEASEEVLKNARADGMERAAELCGAAAEWRKNQSTKDYGPVQKTRWSAAHLQAKFLAEDIRKAAAEEREIPDDN